MKFILLITALCATSTTAFQFNTRKNIPTSITRSLGGIQLSANNVKHDEIENIPSYKVEDVELSNIQSADSATILTFGLLAAMLLVPESAQALESVPHFLQGKVASLIHPFTNILLFLTSLYSAKLVRFIFPFPLPLPLTPNFA